MPEHKSIKELLTFYMGKNTPDRQTYIVDNLRVEAELEARVEEVVKGLPEAA
jgi:topoisomerase-4 subunit B